MCMCVGEVKLQQKNFAIKVEFKDEKNIYCQEISFPLIIIFVSLKNLNQFSLEYKNFQPQTTHI